MQAGGAHYAVGADGTGAGTLEAMSAADAHSSVGAGSYGARRQVATRASRSRCSHQAPALAWSATACHQAPVDGSGAPTAPGLSIHVGWDMSSGRSGRTRTARTPPPIGACQAAGTCVWPTR